MKFRDFNWQSAKSTRKLRSPWRNREYTTRFYSALRSFCLNHPVGPCELRGFVGLWGPKVVDRIFQVTCDVGNN